MDKKRWLGKKLLKKVIEKHGSAILETPEKLSAEITAEDPEIELYGMQIAMFLKATHIAGILTDRERFEALGRAGYENLLVRAMKETGFSYEIIKGLGDDLTAALGYQKNRWKYPEIVDSLKLPMFKDENGVLNSNFGTARGQDAYACAVKWLQSDEKLQVNNMNVSLVPTMSYAATMARKYLERAVKDGCIEAYRLLGLCCYYGVGKEKNEAEALSDLMKADGYTRGSYSDEAKKALMELMDHERKEKRKRMEVTGYTVLTMFLINLSGMLFRPMNLPIFIAAVVINLAAEVYFLFIQKSSEKKRNIFACTSLTVWCLMVLQICW